MAMQMLALRPGLALTYVMCQPCSIASALRILLQVAAKTMHGRRLPLHLQMEGNPEIRQIPWDDNQDFVDRWTNAQTGFPWIDAIMTQLHQWGWMHHLARHSVACFLTRGDLYCHWERGRDVFDKLLIDGDFFINNGNWQWLSCSNFFYQYYRVYSPVRFPTADHLYLLQSPRLRGLCYHHAVLSATWLV